MCLVIGEDRGPILEVIVSRTNFIASHTGKTLRVIGLSTALANAQDLADWLGIKQVNKSFLYKVFCSNAKQCCSWDQMVRYIK